MFPSVTKVGGVEEGKVTLCITTPAFLGYFYTPVGISLSDKEVGRVGGGEGNTGHNNSHIPRIFLYTCGCPSMCGSLSDKAVGGAEGGKVSLCITTPAFLEYFYIPEGVRVCFLQ